MKLLHHVRKLKFNDEDFHASNLTHLSLVSFLWDKGKRILGNPCVIHSVTTAFIIDECCGYGMDNAWVIDECSGYRMDNAWVIDECSGYGMLPRMGQTVLTRFFTIFLQSVLFKI